MKAKKARREGKAPPSPRSRPPHVLWPQNKKAWDVSIACMRKPLVEAFVGVLGFREDAIERHMLRFGVDEEEWDEVYEKVLLFEDWWTALISKRAKEKTSSPPEFMK